MGYVSLKGITISTIPYKEKDKIIVIFTDQLGKIRARIRSVRSMNSKRSGFADEFIYEKLMLYRKGDFFTITEAELISPFLEAKSRIENYKTFLYIRELVSIFSSYEQSDIRIFNLILKTLNLLEKRGIQDVATIYFILYFLKYSGNPIRTVNTDKAYTFFNPEEGGFTEKNGGIKVKRNVVQEIELFYQKNINDITGVEHTETIMNLLNSFILYHTNSKHFEKFLETIRKFNNI